MFKRSTTQLPLLALLLLVIVGGVAACSMARQAPIQAFMPTGAIELESMQPRELKENHFKSDRVGNLTEAQLREILDAPVYLDDARRIGVVPVATAYEVDPDLPIHMAPRLLSEALEATGHFSVSTEVSTDWPKTRSVAGLRELAARYRVKYLLLYRHRFVQRTYTNAWGWTYPTILGLIFAPAETLESAGVLEATLFEVTTGTILFTEYQRIHGTSDETVWSHDRKRRALKERLLKKASDKLAGKVVHQVQRLVAARPEATEKAAATASLQAPRLQSLSSNTPTSAPVAKVQALTTEIIATP